MSIKPGSKWIHTSGEEYEVVCLANNHAEEGRRAEYPMTVVYKRLNDNTVWTRPVERWQSSFTRLPKYALYEHATRSQLPVQHVIVGGYIVNGRFVSSDRVPSEFELVEVD